MRNAKKKGKMEIEKKKEQNLSDNSVLLLWVTLKHVVVENFGGGGG